MHTIKTALLIATMWSCVSATAHAQDNKATRRWALLWSAEDGGQGRAKLRYAQADAQGVGRVLTQLGGVAAKDVRALHNPTARRVSDSISALRAEIEAARAEGRPTQVIFYYSGHSDERGLLLGAERLEYVALRREIEALPADVRVVILDSCASGSLTRTKGGRVVPGFMQDASTQVQGQAILTSSSADEAAQESDRLGASFFTHALLTGLRGGADLSGDGRVTLNEAYQFAFNETLARTERTQGGAQHPGYELKLAGQGDLVLTDLTQATSALVLERSLSGQLYVRDARGALVIELTKQAGRAVELALPADTYTLRLVTNGRAQEATVKLTSGQRLAPTGWQAASMDGGIARKGSGEGDDAPLWVGVDFLPYVGTSSVAPGRSRRISLNVLGGISGGTRGVEIGALNINDGDMFGAQLGAVNLVSGDVMGVQLSAANVVGGDADGLLASAANVSGGAQRGVHLSALNIAGASSWGVQATAASLIGGDFAGVQLAALNVVAGEMAGVQTSAVNVVLGQLNGLQIGAVNVAHTSTSGVQIGAINISKEADYALGAINIVTDGQTRGVSWVDDTMTLHAGLRHGGRSFYQVYFGQARPGEGEEDAAVGFGMGLGGMRPLTGAWSMRGELLTSWYITERATWSRPTNLHQARVLAAWDVFSWMSVVAGPTFNVFISDAGDRGLDWTPLKAWRTTDEASALDVTIWPGLSLGVEFL